MARLPASITSLDTLRQLLAGSRYQALLGEPAACLRTGTRTQFRQFLRERSPAGPGVYGLLDRRQQLIYVGMSRQLHRRLPCYFSEGSSSPKERRIGRRVQAILWQPAAHPLIAALRERELIQAFRPAFNRQGQPSGISWGYIVLSHRAAPRFSLQREIPSGHGGVWGPIPLTRRMALAVEQINLHFQLRDCPNTTPIQFAGARRSTKKSQESFTPCLRADLKTCLAPCIGGCRERQYQAAVRSAVALLNGDTGDCLAGLKREMTEAAQARLFERAAGLRDRWHAFTRIDQLLRRFHEWTQQASFLYTITSELDGQTWWLLCLRGVVVNAVPAPQSAVEKQQVLAELEQIREALQGQSGGRTITTTHEFSAARLLHRWFRLHPEERSRQYSLEQALALCRPGKSRAKRA